MYELPMPATAMPALSLRTEEKKKPHSEHCVAPPGCSSALREAPTRQRQTAPEPGNGLRARRPPCPVLLSPDRGDPGHVGSHRGPSDLHLAILCPDVENRQGGSGGTVNDPTSAQIEPRPVPGTVQLSILDGELVKRSPGVRADGAHRAELTAQAADQD